MGWLDVLVHPQTGVGAAFRCGVRGARGGPRRRVPAAYVAGEGVAQVELDYVTPRFRDFSPGEFVFRRSGLFRDRGFSKLVTPAGMVAPYYDRLGLRRDGESYVLDVS